MPASYRPFRWLFVLLTFTCLDATAASIQLQAFVQTFSMDFAPPGGVCEPVPGHSECKTATGSAGLTNPVTTGPVSVTSSVFQPGNGTQVPNFTLSAQALSSATIGSLHASAAVQITGKGNEPVGRFVDQQVGARGSAQIIDDIQVKSATLAKGTPVTLNTLFEVSGTGGGVLDLKVQGFGTADNLNFGRFGTLFEAKTTASDFGGPNSLADITGSFDTFVGDFLHVTYSLTAFTRMFSNGWSETSVLNGRANNSFYQNSAHLYFEAADPALGIFLDNGFGTQFNYAFPATVPVPGSMLLLLSALPLALRLPRRVSKPRNP